VEQKKLNPEETKIYLYDGNSKPMVPNTAFKATNLNLALKNASTKPLPKVSSFYDIVCYVYTSGTTGLPKAAALTTAR